MNKMQIIESHFNDHAILLNKMPLLFKDIDNISRILINCLKKKKTIFWCGNGGSASDSQHLAGELVGRFVGDRKPLKSIALNADSAVMTCIVNDYGYEHLFSRQIEGLGSNGDVLIGISTSGNSVNVLNALKSAKNIGINTIGLLGNGGGKAKKIVDNSIIIPSKTTARIQEMHILVGHILCDLIEDGLNLK
jgi:D-sedoheptulose 7-phosphate isomerase